MDIRVQSDWLSALRSGDYQQTRGRLKKPDGFCCLGVLCDLYIKENNLHWDIDEDGDYYLFDEEGTLPKKVMEWAGLEDPNPDVSYGEYAGIDIAHLNDKGLTFNEIANIIEEQL